MTGVFRQSQSQSTPWVDINDNTIQPYEEALERGLGIFNNKEYVEGQGFEGEGETL